MTEMELFNILDKIGIDASSERFTQESFEYDNPFYEFDEYMNKNYPDFNYVIDSGATKCVIIPKNEDYVLKIPFTGYEDWDNQSCEEDEETGEWIYDEDYDPFVPFEDGDYCRRIRRNIRRNFFSWICKRISYLCTKESYYFLADR